MSFRITTTGLQDPVVFYDLGNVTYSHPTTDYDLEDDFTEAEIKGSLDIQSAIDNGYITVKDQYGNSITNIRGAISHGELSSLGEDTHLQYAKNCW
jgi:hypothetical protein